MLSTLSDKALLERARKGDDEAATTLLRRWCCKGVTAAEACAAWRCLSTLSTSAAKRAVAVMAATRSGACSCC